MQKEKKQKLNPSSGWDLKSSQENASQRKALGITRQNKFLSNQTTPIDNQEVGYNQRPTQMIHYHFAADQEKRKIFNQMQHIDRST